MVEVKNFQSLDFGSTNPNPVKTETINVKIDPNTMLLDYGRSFAKECWRVNPQMAERLSITEDEMASYCLYLLKQRIATIEDTCTDWRKLKMLFIPAFVQYAMSMVGIVTLRDQGLVIKPYMEECETITFDEAAEISAKISYFERDLQIVQDAMPRDVKGDASVMSTALIAGYIRSIRKVDHIADTYIATFLGFKIKEETSMAVLYRTQYDDVDYVVSALSRARLF